MKNVLVFSMGGHEFQEACQYEAALEQSKLGNEVFFLYCDGSLGICGDNRRCSSVKCKTCRFLFNRRRKKFLNSNIHQIPLSQFLSKDSQNELSNISFNYQNSEELKNIHYHDIDIGFGALSSYITWTRNLNPIISKDVRSFFDLLLASEIKLTMVLEEALSLYKIDLVVFHNGRYAYYKPAYRLAQLKGIPYICTETAFDLNRNVYREFVDNDIPHSVDFWTKKMNRYWDKDTNIDKRNKLAESFFKNRRNAKFSGDKIYIENQIAGKLPEGFDKEVENIAIFNSSEDEFGAIGEEVAKYALFKSQYDGIVAIAEKYKNDKTKHFYLRIHPNLNNVPFDYHVNLYKLDYPNLTVIPGTSDISSYSLMEAVDKVIVFGSTMGAESAYWKKPVICLSFAFYYNLGCVYTPKTVEETWKLIETKNLPLLDTNASLKFGYAILTPEKEHFHYVNMDGSNLMIRGKGKFYPSINKFLGSIKLSYIVSKAILHLFYSFPNTGRFTRVPV